MNNKKTVKRNIRFTVFAVLFAILSVFSVVLSACGNSAITLSENEITMYVSDSARLEYTAADEDAEVTWTSSNEDVVTVRRGTVLAKAVGEATVTASVEGGSDTCKITVLDRTVTISQQTATIDLDSDNLSVTLTAEASDGGAITWSTSDSALATVNNGVVTALRRLRKNRIGADRTDRVGAVRSGRPDRRLHRQNLLAPEQAVFAAVGIESGDRQFRISDSPFAQRIAAA